MVVTLKFPRGIRPLNASGDSRATIKGRQVSFGAVDVSAREKVSFRVKVRVMRQGDLLIKAFLQSDLLRKPVTEEELTQVY